MVSLVPQPKVTRNDLYWSGAPYSAEYPSQPVSQSVYAIRDTSAHFVNLALAGNGYTDMGVQITHTYSASGSPLAVLVTLKPVMDVSAATTLGLGARLGPNLLQATYGEYVQKNDLFWFVPEIGPYITESPDTTPALVVREVPELRGPFDLIRMTITCVTPAAAGPYTATAPDAGELAFRLVRRS